MSEWIRAAIYRIKLARCRFFGHDFQDAEMTEWSNHGESRKVNVVQCTRCGTFVRSGRDRMFVFQPVAWNCRCTLVPRGREAESGARK